VCIATLITTSVPSLEMVKAELFEDAEDTVIGSFSQIYYLQVTTHILAGVSCVVLFFVDKLSFLFSTVENSFTFLTLLQLYLLIQQLRILVYL